MKKIIVTVLFFAFNLGFSQVNGVYKSKDGLYKLIISKSTDDHIDFVWEAIYPDDLCSCGGEGIAYSDNFEPQKGEYFLLEEDPQGGAISIIQFNFKPNNSIVVKMIGEINDIWLCGNGCPLTDQVFYRVVPKK